jgi:hypothetical protein
MSDRERWIVYPLLLLSLGMGIRGNKVFPKHEFFAEKVHADELSVNKIRCLDLNAQTIHSVTPLQLLPLSPPAEKNPGLPAGAK